MVYLTRHCALSIRCSSATCLLLPFVGHQPISACALRHRQASGIPVPPSPSTAPHSNLESTGVLTKNAFMSETACAPVDSSSYAQRLTTRPSFISDQDILWTAHLMYNNVHNFEATAFLKFFEFVENEAASLIQAHTPPLPQLLRHLLSPQSRDQSCSYYFRALCDRFGIPASTLCAADDSKPDEVSTRVSAQPSLTRVPQYDADYNLAEHSRETPLELTNPVSPSSDETVRYTPPLTTKTSSDTGTPVDGEALLELNPAVVRMHLDSSDCKEALTQEILHFDGYLRPNPVLFSTKRGLMERLNELAGVENEENHFYAFGSSTNGFCVRGSDIDVCLVAPNLVTSESQRCILRSLHKQIRKNLASFSRYNVKRSFFINARVPIIKLLDASGRDVCDISINNTTALDNSHLTAFFGQYDRRVRILGHLLKYWATRRNINNRAHGTLSTYAILLFLFFFLQNRSPPILPHYALITREAATHFLQTHPNVATTLLTEQRACQRAPAMCNAVQAASELSLSDTLPVDKLLESEIIELAVRYLCQSPKGDWALPFIRNVNFVRTYLAPAPENKETLGQLLCAFFQFYGSDSVCNHLETTTATQSTNGGFENIMTGHAVDLTSGQLQQSASSYPPYLQAVCPITKQCVSPLTSDKWKIISAELRRGKSLMSQDFPLHVLCQEIRPLSKMSDDDTEDTTPVTHHQDERLRTLGDFVRILCSKENDLLPPTGL